MPGEETNRSGQVIFLGDSLTAGFDLEKHFPGKNTRNLGISGDTSFDLIYRLEEVTGSHPDRIFLMIGINDIFSGHTQDALLDNIQHMVEKFQDHCPGCKIYVQSILPIRDENLLIDESGNITIYQVNTRLKALCKELKATYIDLYPDFLDNSGQLDRKYTYDGAHLTGEGYELWQELINGVLHE